MPTRDAVDYYESRRPEPHRRVWTSISEGHPEDTPLFLEHRWIDGGNEYARRKAKPCHDGLDLDLFRDLLMRKGQILDRSWRIRAQSPELLKPWMVRNGFVLRIDKPRLKRAARLIGEPELFADEATWRAYEGLAAALPGDAGSRNAKYRALTLDEICPRDGSASEWCVPKGFGREDGISAIQRWLLKCGWSTAVDNIRHGRKNMEHFRRVAAPGGGLIPHVVAVRLSYLRKRERDENCIGQTKFYNPEELKAKAKGRTRRTVRTVSG